MSYRLILATVVALALPKASFAQPEMSVKIKILAPKEAPAPAAEGEGEGEEDPGTPASKQPPIIRALVDIEIPGLTAKKFELRDAEDETIRMAAESVVTFREADEPMAMVILVQGNFRWMGNEQYEDPADPEAGTIYDGAHIGLAPAIDALAKAGPSNSKAALLVYADGQTLAKQAMGPASALSGAALGGQADFKDYISKPLIVGLTDAFKLLANEADSRRILVVIGDGNDDSEDINAELAKVLADLQNIEVEVYSIHYTSVAEDGPQGQQNMKKIGYTRRQVATSRANFKSFADNFVEFIGARYYVDFSAGAYDGMVEAALSEAKAAAEKKNDPNVTEVSGSLEREVVVALKADGEPVLSEPQSIQLPWWTPSTTKEASLWWLWLIIIGVVVLLLLIIIIVATRKKKAPEPQMPMPMDAFEPPPPEPASRHTVMLGVGGTAESMPVVGWVVPLNGPNQFQTFKLLQGKTKMGTGGSAHVVVSDTYMTAEHAEIISSPTGFLLNDLGSTNGSFLNKQRVSTQELVDNDVIRLGKTEFKFKSIN